MSSRRRPWSVPVRTLVVAGLLAASVAGAVVTAGPAGASPLPDPERMSTTPTAWVVRASATEAEVNGLVATGYRVTSVQVVTTTGPRFAVTMVKNSGSYARTWWWTFNQTRTSLATQLSSRNARLIDLEPYRTSAGVRYAAVMVRNTDPANKTWAWYVGTTPAAITSYTAANAMRPVDIDRVVLANGAQWYTAVYIKNTGVDAKPWWHYYNLTAAQVRSYGAARSATPLTIEQRSAGRFDVLYVGGSPARTVTFDETSAGMLAGANQSGTRVVQALPSTVAGRYHYLRLDTLDSESKRIRGLVAAGMSGSSYGWYVKKVGGSVATTLQPDTVFEPASTMKAVHLLAAMKEIQPPGGVSLSSTLAWYVRPSDPARYPSNAGYDDDKNKCAYTSTGVAITTVKYTDTFQTLANQMMQYSDNRATDAFLNRYGYAGLNSLMASLGMTNSSVRHRIGCGDTWKPDHDAVANRLTSRDIGRLYEAVVNGSALDATSRTAFFGRMLGGVLTSGDLRTMITSELISAGLSATERNTFLSRVLVRSKGGSYDLCLRVGPCDGPVRTIRTGAGVLWLPFKSGSTITDTPHVYSQWFDKTVPCTFASVKGGTCTSYKTTATAYGVMAIERFRSSVRAAAATW